MSERGVFAVDRGIFTDPDFADEPFTEREAFMWMVSEAAWKDHPKRVDGKVISLKRGQLCHSIRFMAEAWKWSKSRVDRFLDRLKNRDTIIRDSGTRTPTITICKYNEFQRVSLPNRDNSGTRAGQERDKLENKESKEVISSSLCSEDKPAQKKRSVKSELERVLDGDHAQAVIDHRNRLRKPLTAHAAKLLAEKLERCPDANAAADIMIERGWQAIDPQWIENLNAPRGHAPPQQPSLADGFKQLSEQLKQQDSNHGGPTIEGSYEHRDIEQPRKAIPRSDAEKRQRGRLDGILPHCLPQIDKARD